eukprot:Opistho-2@89394
MQKVGVCHIKVVALARILSVDSRLVLPCKRSEKVLAGPSIECRALCEKSLLVTIVEEWNAGKEKQDSRRKVCLVEAIARRRHPPLVVIVEKHKLRVSTLALFRIVKIVRREICLECVHESARVVLLVLHRSVEPVVRRIRNAAVHCALIRAADEGVVVAPHVRRLATPRHCGSALAGAKELPEYKKVVLSERFGVVADSRSPRLEERQRHLHRRVHSDAVNIYRRNQCLGHCNDLGLHPRVLRAQIVHDAVYFADVILPRIRVILKITVVVEIAEPKTAAVAVCLRIPIIAVDSSVASIRIKCVIDRKVTVCL